MYRLICATCALLCLCACKKPPQPDTRGVGNITASVPIIAGGTPDDVTLKFGFNFKSTITTSPYAVVQEDCGTIKRFNRVDVTEVSLPLLPYPCVMVLANDNLGPVKIGATAGDISGDKSVTILNHESVFLSVNQSSAFWRGFGVTGRVHSGTGAPAATRCDSAEESGQLYVDKSLGVVSVCSDAGWQPVGFGSSGAVSPIASYSNMSDFKATLTSAAVLTIAPGSAAINSYSFPAQMGGTVTFTGGTGDAKVYVSKLGILTTEGITGSKGTVTGQMVYLTAAVPSFPPGSIPICDLTLNAGKYTVDGSDGCKLASRVRASAFDPGSGIDIKYTAGVGKVAVDATVARTDGTNVWTNTNDFRNANVLLPAGAVTQSSSKTLSVISLIFSLAALAIVIWIVFHKEAK